MKKIQANKATRENLTQVSLPGISSPRYEIGFYIPLDWVPSPKEEVGVSAAYINDAQFRTLIYYSASNTIKKVNKTNIFIQLEVSENYIDRFLSAVQLLSDSASIKINE